MKLLRIWPAILGYGPVGILVTSIVASIGSEIGSDIYRSWKASAARKKALRGDDARAVASSSSATR